MTAFTANNSSALDIQKEDVINRLEVRDFKPIRLHLKTLNDNVLPCLNINLLNHSVVMPLV